MTGGDTSVCSRFALNGAERSQLQMLRRYDERYLDLDVATWIEWDFTVDGDSQFGATSIRTNWHDGSVLEIAREVRRNDQTVAEVASHPLMSEKLDYNPIISTGSPSWTRTLENRVAGGVLFDFADLLAGWRSQYFHFPAVRGGSEREQQLRQADSVLTPSGQNLGGVLLHLKVNEPSLWQKLQDLVSAVFARGWTARNIYCNIGALDRVCGRHVSQSQTQPA